MTKITVLTARRIRTMNPSMPLATAVAIRDGMILEVGTLETLRPWLDAYPHQIDDTFAEHVLMPGFIDPHLHPSLAAILLPCHFITAMEWKLPDRVAAPVRGHNAYLDRLKDIESGISDPGEPVVTWGYHKIWHGHVDRQTLNCVSQSRPIFVWQRSFHEIIVNDAAIDWMKLNRGELARHPQVDVETGRFFETGLSIAMNGMKDYLYAPDRFRQGLQQVKQAVHFGGHTTIADMAVPLVDIDVEWPPLLDIFERDDTPFRVQMIPRAIERGGALGRESEQLERVRALS
ncbi:MAG: amidohydrolase family protein, partial [Hyphomicrobiaceae bacterium]